MSDKKPQLAVQNEVTLLRGESLLWRELLRNE
jgi:hypothetical protein